MLEHHFAIEGQADQGSLDRLVEILNTRNRELGLSWQPEPISIFIRDEKQKVLGGLTGNTNWRWLYISQLAVDPALRDKGYGRKLVEMAEEEAIKRGCLAAYLNTFSFQAVDFYRKLGYEIYGQLDDFPPGHKRYFLRKFFAKNDSK